MKKKIISLCLVVVLALTAIGGATLAYFTDQDAQENTFTLGNIDIKVDEYGYVKDSVTGEYIDDAFDYDEGGMYYSNLMPSYEIGKKPVIINESSRNAAYVRVAVVMNHVTAINNAIDEVYENKTNSDGEAYDIQAIYDNVFNGWDLQYNKREGRPGIRLWMDEDAKEVQEGATLIAVDSIQKAIGGQTRFDYLNRFLSADEVAIAADPQHYGDVLQPGQKSYYDKAVEDDQRVYVFYLKLEPNAQYTLFDGLNVPADFNNEQMEMFNELFIGVYADAIQTVGFNTDDAGINAAFEALEAEHPLGWWHEYAPAPMAE